MDHFVDHLLDAVGVRLVFSESELLGRDIGLGEQRFAG
jgi:hypothetical protein